MNIRKATDADQKEWDAYVHRHPEGSPFHLTAWQLAVRKAFNHPEHYFIAEDDGKICGLFPAIQLKSLLFGNILSSVPFAAEGGMLADNDTVFDTLLAEAKNLTRTLGADYCEFKFFHPKETGLNESGSHFSFIKELSTDHDTNMKAIPRKQRAMVRKGIKAGLAAITGNDRLDDFYEIFARNVHRLGTPVYPKKWFKALLDTFGDNAEVMVVEHEGKVISGVFTLYYKDKVLPYYAGSLLEHRRLAPNDFQYWQLMCRAVDRGCRYFDYGRSKKGSGHYSFKKNWGFEPKPLHYQFFLNTIDTLPEVNPLNPRYKRKIELWKKLPHQVTRIIGPYIVKNIP